MAQHGFLGLSALGWLAYMILWVAQAFIFWHGMESIRRFIDWAGPAVYVVMFALAIYLVWKAGIGNINLTLGTVKFSGLGAIPTMLMAVSLVGEGFLRDLRCPVDGPVHDHAGALGRQR